CDYHQGRRYCEGCYDPDRSRMSCCGRNNGGGAAQSCCHTWSQRSACRTYFRSTVESGYDERRSKVGVRIDVISLSSITLFPTDCSNCSSVFFCFKDASSLPNNAAHSVRDSLVNKGDTIDNIRT